MAKRYFWLKLKEDFFNQPLIRAVERGEEGGSVVLFYLKLLTLGIRTEGRLRISNAIPYDIPGLADDTRTDPTFAQRAATRLQELGFLTLQEDGTYFLPGLDEMIGSEGVSSERVRKHRDKALHCNTNVTLDALHCNANVTQRKNIEIDKEIESEQEKEGRKGEVFVGKGQDWNDLRVELSMEERRNLVDQMGLDQLASYLEKMDQFVETKGRRFKNPYQTILKWYQEDCG